MRTNRARMKGSESKAPFVADLRGGWIRNGGEGAQARRVTEACEDVDGTLAGGVSCWWTARIWYD